MALNEGFRDFVLDQLAGLGEFETKRMFGGMALLYQGSAFAKIKHDKVWLKVDDRNKNAFIESGMRQYTYGKDNSRTLNFYETPMEIIEDRDKLVEWAKESIKVVIATK
ncbi:MAG: TfoX/Sxy family protein [Cyclobacteriaceae bacterium]